MAPTRMGREARVPGGGCKKKINVKVFGARPIRLTPWVLLSREGKGEVQGQQKDGLVRRFSDTSSQEWDQ